MRSRFVNAKKIFEAFDLIRSFTACVLCPFLFRYIPRYFISTSIVTIIYHVIRRERTVTFLVYTIDRCGEQICVTRPFFNKLDEIWKIVLILVACPALIYRPCHDVKIPLRFWKATLKSMKSTKLLTLLKFYLERLFASARQVPDPYKITATINSKQYNVLCIHIKI